MRRVLGRPACLLPAPLVVHVLSGLWDLHQPPLDQVLVPTESETRTHDGILFVRLFLQLLYVLVLPFPRWLVLHSSWASGEAEQRLLLVSRLLTQRPIHPAKER